MILPTTHLIGYTWLLKKNYKLVDKRQFSFFFLMIILFKNISSGFMGRE